MAGPVQKAMSDVVTIASGATAAAKKLKQDEKQIKQEESAALANQKMAEEAIQQEAQDNAIEADLIRMGADEESARAFMNARKLNLDTKGFGMIRNKKGRFVGSYSSLAEKLSKDALTDSLSSKVINNKGFAKRLHDISNSRKGRVEVLVEASKGGEKNG